MFVETLKGPFYDRMFNHSTKNFTDMLMNGELILGTMKSGKLDSGETKKTYKKRDNNELNTTNVYSLSYSTGVVFNKPNTFNKSNTFAPTVVNAPKGE
ncbi:hypothetical protein HRI_003234300 [Hibiscus trionum]|uniref:Uncharacterized protein n=1 Tax=Hibiscus trionum TaxID=183268 RepID=A0A9W7IIX9_HIBTR|nr:hypothetical protein HRI_003234300 [Hibiscus trionum]